MAHYLHPRSLNSSTADTSISDPTSPPSFVITPASQTITLSILSCFLFTLIAVLIYCTIRSSIKTKRARASHALEVEATVQKVQQEMIINMGSTSVAPPDYEAQHFRSTLRPEIVKAIDDNILALSVLGCDQEEMGKVGELWKGEVENNKLSPDDTRKWTEGEASGSSSGSSSMMNLLPPAYVGEGEAAKEVDV